MNNVKSWKKNLKKTGALALATLVMCGSASFVHALEDVDHTLPVDSITLNESGNDTLGEQVVKGYQTSPAVGYAANITWGNMTFVYDNGTYDPKTGRLIATTGSDIDSGKVQGNANYVKDEEGENTDTLAPGNWYGFDGINNAVKIENLSTDAVEITATPKSDGPYAGENMLFNLYTFNENFTLTETTDHSFAENSEFKNHVADEVYKDPEHSSKCYFASAEVGLKRTFEAATLDVDGSLKTSDKDAIYLNITGKPSGTLAPVAGSAGELGHITLSFAATNGNNPFPLTPKESGVEQGNQG